MLNSSVGIKKKIVGLPFIEMERKHVYKKKILLLNFHHIFLPLKKLNFALMDGSKQTNSSGYSWLGFFCSKLKPEERVNE